LVVLQIPKKRVHELQIVFYTGEFCGGRKHHVYAQPLAMGCKSSLVKTEGRRGSFCSSPYQHAYMQSLSVVNVPICCVLVKIDLF